MKKKIAADSQLHKIIFLIDALPETELLSRTLMELWMSGYEAERIPVEQILPQLTEALPDHDAQNDVPADSQTILIVTDRTDLADAALRHGIAVIGYLHEKNKDASFQGVRYLITDISGLDARFCELAYCRAHGLPLTVIETARCLIREITLEDIPRLYEIYADPAVTDHMEALYADEAAERSYIRDYIDKIYGFYGYGMWVVIHKEDSLLIGRAGIEPKEDTAELGYVIAKEYRRQGYAAEVCRAILLHAADCLCLPEVCARVHKDNAASLRLCEKLKFQPLPQSDDPDMLLFRRRLN